MDNRNEGNWETINRNRDFMKFTSLEKFQALQTSVKTDQTKKLPQPPLGYPCKGQITELECGFDCDMNISYANLLDLRRSVRVFDENIQITQKQLAFLLWSAQGVQEIRGNNYATFRPVPSGGARHPFELYFIAISVEGLKQGIYRYAPLEHTGEKRAAIEYKSDIENCDTIISEIFLHYPPKNASLILLISCVAYRAEWRYGHMAHRAMLIDLGHVGQNIMLSSAALGLGSCCYAAYDQDLCDQLLCLDSHEEYTVYVCSAGSISKQRL